MSQPRSPEAPSPCTRPPATPAATAHKELRDDAFWQQLPAYRHLSAQEFHDHRFQSRNCVTNVAKLREVVGPLVPESFYQDVGQGVLRSTMSLRLSPYILSLIDWKSPAEDPLRLQFLPLASRWMPDHPELALDSLHEQKHSPVPGLTHRYADRALFLALDTCPVYCRFCTRSYAVGLDTLQVEKLHFGASSERWEQAFSYIASRPELEDIVVSGGDVYNLRPEQLEHIGNTLLDLEHIRRLRFATKGPAVMPQKLVGDQEWVGAFLRVVERSRQLHKAVALHTHFNHPNEITAITRQGLDFLAEQGVVVRNQCVLQRGVNDRAETMQLLVKRLSFLNVQPYYVFVHDMVKGVEELRTTLQQAMDLEKQVRGTTAGFHVPTFVLDTKGGGGKRDVHSYEYYDREEGIAVFTSPTVMPGTQFLYFDPVHTLSSPVQRRWAEEGERAAMIRTALDRAASRPRRN
ncbi:MAG: KamA family radical SAM protein [Candidatus Handelsmanbacteria bacterium]|nr:KamA family radical SAM protein [Candidatus Handelsmanbacteria bacterium]